MRALGEIMQQGYIVDDVERDAERWAQRLGVGPFYLVDVAIDDYHYRGEASECRLRIAIAYWGAMQIELIQPLNADATLYTDALPEERGRLNHCGTIVSDLDTVIERHNLKSKILQSGSIASGARFVYLDRYLPCGAHLELIQSPSESLAAMAGIQAFSKIWDGKRPIRTQSDLADDLLSLR